MSRILATLVSDLFRTMVQSRSDAESNYPSSELANRLGLIAQLIKAGLGTRVYYTIQPGYDTHSVQLPNHSRRLRELSNSLKAFLDDLVAAKLDDRVLVVCFSEFGRRVKENASAGTDHGTAGPVLLAGSRVKPGIVGRTPCLTDLANGDLKHTTDFRSVYATVIEDWLGIPASVPLPGSVKKLQLLRL